MKRTYSLILLSVALLFGGCANIWLKRGNKNYQNEAYFEAINAYTKSLNKNPSDEVKAKLAVTYLKLNNSAKAEELFRDVVKVADVDPVNQLYFGRVLLENRKFDEAKYAFEEYAKKFPDDRLVKNLIYSATNWKEFDKGLDSCSFSLKKIDANGFNSSYGAAAYGDGYVFSSESTPENKKHTDKLTGQTYLDLFFIRKDKSTGTWSKPELLKGGINTEYHDAMATFSSDGKTVYFTRSNEKNDKPVKNDQNEVTLKIMKATLLDGEWTNIEEFPFNSDDYSNAHPSLSRDGQSLYFSSDRPGGYGEADLYVTNWDGNKWSDPVNLGPEINTPAREIFPSIAFNGTLYFSSDGHPGLGGLDVFKSKKEGGIWSKPENLKTPVNSSKDDFSFSMDEDGKIGNVSSSRLGNDKDVRGNDQMFELIYKDPIVKTIVCVLKNDSITPFQGATVLVKNIATAEKDSAITDAQGNATLWLKGEGDYTIRANSNKYFTSSISVSTKGKACTDVINTCAEGKKIYLEEADTTGKKEYSIGDIFYDFDKYDIRKDAEENLDRLVKLLKDNPSFTVEMGSHTDCRGTDTYNQILSENRAKSVVKYCTLRDINSKRLTYKGYGETEPKAKCVCEMCTEEEHQANRRTTFRIVVEKKSVPTKSKEKKKKK